MVTRIAAFGCAHLGYTTNCRRNLPDGTNPIAADGYAAHHQVMEIAARYTQDHHGTIIDAGDLFHTPKPGPKDIVEALKADLQRWYTPDAHPTRRLSIPGNHDRAGATTIPATVVMGYRDNLHCVAPDVPTGKGDPRCRVVVPGFYEIWDVTNDDGCTPTTRTYVHMVNEQVLAPTAGSMNTKVDPQIVDGGINLLVTHGIIPDMNGTVAYHHGADERGGERVIPLDWFNRGFDLAVLADYHTPDSGMIADTPYLYTGSAVRRGFSDAECDRGVTLIEVDDDGAMQVGFKPIPQRQKVDLTVDCDGVGASEIIDTVDSALNDIDPVDTTAQHRTGEGGKLIRITLTNVTDTIRPGLSDAHARWVAALTDALSVSIQVKAPDAVPDEEGAAEVLAALPELGREGIDVAFRRLAESDALKALDGLPHEKRDAVITLATARLMELAAA